MAHTLSYHYISGDYSPCHPDDDDECSSSDEGTLLDADNITQSGRDIIVVRKNLSKKLRLKDQVTLGYVGTFGDASDGFLPLSSLGLAKVVVPGDVLHFCLPDCCTLNATLSTRILKVEKVTSEENILCKIDSEAKINNNVTLFPLHKDGGPSTHADSCTLCTQAWRRLWFLTSEQGFYDKMAHTLSYHYISGDYSPCHPDDDDECSSSDEGTLLDADNITQSGRDIIVVRKNLSKKLRLKDQVTLGYVGTFGDASDGFLPLSSLGLAKVVVPGDVLHFCLPDCCTLNATLSTRILKVEKVTSEENILCKIDSEAKINNNVTLFPLHKDGGPSTTSHAESCTLCSQAWRRLW